MRRLLLLTPAELTRDPRARRAAVAALGRGFEVVGLCGQASGESPAALAGVHVERVGRAKEIRELGLPQAPATPLQRELRGLYRLSRLALRTVRMRRRARSLGRPDIVHANDFDTLPAAWLVARGCDARLVYDAHELYSEFEPEPPRLYRRAALALEGALARRADAVATVSEPIAAELVARLGLNRAPIVVLNAPELDQREPFPPATDGRLRAVYQGSFGVGRRPSDLLDAVAEAPSVHLTLLAARIDPGRLRGAVSRRGLAGRVDVAEAVPPDRLGEALRRFEVGVLFDSPVTRNGELSLPNKLFDYLMAGLAVVAPRLPALSPVVDDERVGLTFEPGGLAAALEHLAANREALAELRARARRLALERYNAEAQSRLLARAWGLAPD